jgi:hypothetical protein
LQQERQLQQQQQGAVILQQQPPQQQHGEVTVQQEPALQLPEEGPFGVAAAAADVSPLAAVSTGQGFSGMSMPMQSSCEDLFMQWQDEGEEAVE